jgi:hypothetical protein
MSATEVQIKFLEVYGGASEKASKTFAGSLLRIKASVEMARESLGKGLVDGLMIATGSQNIDELQKKIVDFGTSAGNTFKTLGGVVKENLGLLKSLAITFAAIWTAGKVIAGIATVTKLVAALTASYKLLRATAVGAAIAQAALLNPLAAIAYGAALVATITAATLSIDNLGKLGAPKPTAAGGGGFTDSQNAARLAAEKKSRAAADKALKDKLAKEKAAALAAANATIAANKKTAAKDLAYKKAAAVFDLTKIQIAAALKATYDKDERLRLLAMQEIENDNGEAALKYINQLKLLTQEQQTNKLAGITAISESELDSINQILLKELARISSSKMTQQEADEARAEAYRKYNAAIIASGGLAEANFYTEKTQTDLLKIAKLAALHDVATAQATLDILNYTSQLDIIARIAAAQKIADDAKTKALKDYLALLGTAAGVIAGSPGGPAIAKGKVEVIPKILPPGVGGGGQPIPPGYGGIFDYLPSTGSTGSSNSSITIVVEGNVLDGDDFVEKVNDALLNAERTGMPQTPAGFLIK